MKTLSKFKTTGASKWNTAEYTNFASRFISVNRSFGAEALHYEEADLERYAELQAELQDLVARNMAATETVKLQDLETQRDEKGMYIINTVRNSRELPFPAIAEAAKALWFVLEPYVGFHSKPNLQETALIDGMLLDLAKSENAAHITALSLTQTVEELTLLNAQYRVLTEQRTTSRDNAKTADAKTLRAEMDQLYEYITTVAFAHNVVNPSDTLEQYIRSVNAIIDETNTAYNQRMAQTKAKGEDEAEGETTA